MEEIGRCTDYFGYSRLCGLHVEWPIFLYAVFKLLVEHGVFDLRLFIFSLIFSFVLMLPR
jgi:hypothetical protein